MLPFPRVHIACTDNQCSTSTLVYEERAQVSPVFALPQSDIHTFLLTRGRRGLASLFEANARSQIAATPIAATSKHEGVFFWQVWEKQESSQIKCCANLFVVV